MGAFKSRVIVAGPADRQGWGLWRQLAAAGLAGLLVIQLARLCGLSGAARDWAAVSALFMLASALIGGLMRAHYPHARIGACNLVTLARAALVAALLAPLLAGMPAGWLVATIGLLALGLDGVDGWLARRSGLVSDFGARFDMEVDAAFALVLALHAQMATGLGALVLFLGSARYLFVLAGAVAPWLLAPLPQRFRRKAICVLQLAVLLILQLPILPPTLAIWLAGIASAALAASFAADILWLRRHR